MCGGGGGDKKTANSKFFVDQGIPNEAGYYEEKKW